MNEFQSLSINKNTQSFSRNLSQYSPYQGCLLHGKSIPYRNSPTEYTVILVGSIPQVF